MHKKNEKLFRIKTVQLFNRFATYNGSNPYKAPALMNMISHLEFNLGAYLPKKMHQITTHLVKLAEEANRN
jgi:phytoene dehydrogenase-like protein